MVTDDPRTLRALIAVYLDWHHQEYPDVHSRVRDILLRVFARFHTLAPEALATFQIERWKLERLTQVRRGTVLKELRTLSALYHAGQRDPTVARPLHHPRH